VAANGRRARSPSEVDAGAGAGVAGSPCPFESAIFCLLFLSGLSVSRIEPSRKANQGVEKKKRASQTGGGASTATLYGHADPGKAISSPIFHRSVFTQDSTRGGGCRAIGVNGCRCLMCYHSPRARYQSSAGGS